MFFLIPYVMVIDIVSLIHCAALDVGPYRDLDRGDDDGHVHAAGDGVRAVPHPGDRHEHRLRRGTLHRHPVAGGEVNM